VARLVTIADIVQRARLHADQRQSQFINDTEALQLFNEVYGEMYDELVDIDENYYASEAPIVISNQAADYDLPDDFYKIIGVDLETSTAGERITLFPYNEGERNIAFTQARNLPSATVYLKYVPAPAIFTSLSQTVDGVAGWDRLLSLALAIDMADAEETNTDRLERKYQKTLQRIRGSLDRDIGMPGTVTDVSRPSVNYLYSSLKYRLYGGQIHFISTEMLSNAIFGGPFV
jgi:hypothetical protein